MDAEVSVHSIRGVDSMVSLRQELPGSGRPGDIEPVVLEYEAAPFADAVPSGSTPERILEEQNTPVVLVP